jgi:hypothetical protein
MAIWRPAVITCGTLLTALLISAACALAQTAAPRLKTLYSFTADR